MGCSNCQTAVGFIYTFATDMPKCPLCSQRSAKRFCPAKAQKICSICCGTKREIEIDCPGDCVHLRTGRSFESARRRSGDELEIPPQSNQQLLYRNATSINAAAQAILEERLRSPSMVDQDVEVALDALKTAMKTLSSGIYYETLPSSGAQAMALYRRLKAVLEQLMAPQGAVGVNAIRVSDIPEVLEFILSTVRSRSSGRPKSRQYLAWLASVVEEPVRDRPSQLILP